MKPCHCLSTFHRTVAILCSFMSRPKQKSPIQLSLSMALALAPIHSFRCRETLRRQVKTIATHTHIHYKRTVCFLIFISSSGSRNDFPILWIAGDSPSSKRIEEIVTGDSWTFAAQIRFATRSKSHIILAHLVGCADESPQVLNDVTRPSRCKSGERVYGLQIEARGSNSYVLIVRIILFQYACYC